jgi:hypothetical protein
MRPAANGPAPQPRREAGLQGPAIATPRPNAAARPPAAHSAKLRSTNGITGSRRRSGAYRERALRWAAG